jgi:hypothetical protein
LTDLSEPLGDEEFWKSIGEQLLDDLLEEYLRIYRPNVYLVLHFWGGIRYEATQLEAPFRRQYTKVVFDWHQVLAMVQDPFTALKRNYKWGDPTAPFEYQRLFEALANVLRAIHMPTNSFAPSLQTTIDFPPDSGHQIQGDADALRTIFLYGFSPRDHIVYEVGLELLPAAKTGQSEPSGLILSPILRGGAEGDLSLGESFSMRWKVAASADDVIGLVMFPDKIGLLQGQFAVGASLEIVGTRTDPWYLLGNARTARIELYSPSIRLSIEGTVDDPEARLRLSASAANGQPGCKVVVPLDDADGFVKETVREKALELSFSPEVVWSSKTGLTFNGKPNVDIDLPLNLSIGPVRVQRLSLRLLPKNNGTDPIFEFEASAGLDVTLGPVVASIDRVGFELALDFARKDKNLGFVDLSAGFKPPSGVGITVDSPAVTGGGFLFLDQEKGQYAGFVQLNIEGGITVTAIGLIDTRLPDGTKGFSFLVMITAEGFQPIQLGMGFTLTGIGGLLAINRTCNEEFLREGIKSNTLNDLLFPNDPIRNAVQIFGTLNNAYPPMEGQYLFGPVVQICWGTPPLITIDVGVILEFGNRTRLVIMGRVSAILPSEKDDLIRLQMNVLGILDFDQHSISLDAALYDSRLVGKFPITGSTAMRLRWGSDPVFALSIGGFHPAFHPPANFPTLTRLAISFSNSEDFRLRAECYYAITSNTYQFGARLELYAKAGDFSIEGHLGYDVLIQFDPFGFLADFSALVQLKYGSHNLFAVSVEGELAGPRPLHIKGKASFSIFWCDFSVHFDKTLVAGEPPPALAPVVVMEQLKAALNDSRNWSGQLADGERRMVTLREAKAPDEIALHPLGRLSVTQKVVPLELEIAKFGNTTPADARLFKINGLTVNGTDVGFDRVTDFFAPSQFLDLSDDEKLAAPSFEAMTAGMRVGAESYLFTTDDLDILEDPVIDYETIIVEKENDEPSKPQPGYSISAEFLQRYLFLGAASRSDLRRTGIARYRPSPATSRKNSVVEQGWSITATADGSTPAAAALNGSKAVSYAALFQALQKLKEENPTQARTLMLIPKASLN